MCRYVITAMLLCAAVLMSSCADGPGSEDNGLSADCGEVPTLPTMKLTVAHGTYLDALGRRVLLRGVNAGGRSKFPPFFPFAFKESGYPGQQDAPAFDDALDAYADRVVAWGHDVVRVPFSWEAVEPEEGQYDDVYLGRLQQMLQAFSDRGVRSVLEFHQDAFARIYCGDGFPLWATSDPERPIPDVEDCDGWFSVYLSTDNEVAKEFHRFWTNADGLQDKMMQMWRHVLQKVGDVDGLVGVEAINEPWQGSLGTQNWATNYMQPLVERFWDLVHETRPELLVFFGSAGTDTLDGKTTVVHPDRDDLSFAPHFYDPFVYAFGTTMGGWMPMRVLDNFWETARTWDVPIFIGETGCKTAQKGCDEYTRDVYDALDTYPMHATAWEYSTTEDDWNNEGYRLTGPGGEESAAVKQTVRVYPEALASSTQTFSFDSETRTASFDLEASADGWSEIVVPDRLYPKGYRVRGTGVSYCATSSPNRLWVRTDAPGTLHLEITAMDAHDAGDAM